MQLLIYPVTDAVERAAARARLFAEGFLLTQRGHGLLRARTTSPTARALDPRASMLRAADLSRPAPRLRRHRRLRPAARRGRGLRGADARRRRAGGAAPPPRLIHGFANLTAISRTARGGDAGGGRRPADGPRAAPPGTPLAPTRTRGPRARRAARRGGPGRSRRGRRRARRGPGSRSGCRSGRRG